MTFPSNPIDGQIVVRFDRNYQYNENTEQWRALGGVFSVIEASIDVLSDVDTSTAAPEDGQVLIWNAANNEFVPGEASSGTGVYADISLLPLTGNSTGDQAFVSATNRLYLWSGAGWFNIALINTNPSITTGPDASYVFATDGTPIVLTLVAEDPEGFPITWSYQVTTGSLGSTATVSQSDNVFTITPSTSEADIGTFGITFTASDGINLATAASSFSLLFIIPNSKYTTVLLKTDDTVVNNNTFVDSSTNNFTVTANGDVYQGSFSPYRVGGYSTYFDGAGDYLQLPSSSEFGYGTGDFTIEFWAFFTSISGTAPNLIDQRNGASLSAVPTLYLNNGQLNYYVNGTNLWSGPTMVSQQWYHIALCRSSGFTKIFVNGVQQGTTLTDNNNYIASPVRVFGSNDSGPVSITQAGYCSNLRIVKGTAIYTNDFTLPTETLTAITNTSLLTCNLPYIKDSSSNNHTITVTGNVSTEPFVPYDYRKYNSITYIGSAYFDGSGDYLSIANQSSFTLGTNSFTLEAWFYPTNVPSASYCTVIGNRSNTSSYGEFGISLISNGYMGIFVGDSPWNILADNGTTAPYRLNQWNHFALVRSGTSVAFFLNGKRYHSVTTSNSISDTGAAFTIGEGAVSGGQPFYGYITDVRYIVGNAVYDPTQTIMTVPTSPLTEVSGTQFLIQNTNAGVYDASQSSNLKLVGNTTLSATETKYADKSVYFDGSGDYIELGDIDIFNLSTVDFTIESWVYPTKYGYGLFRKSSYTGADAPPGVAVYVNASSVFASIGTGAYEITTSGTIPTNQWSHFAMVRSGTSFKVYLNGTVMTNGSATISSSLSADSTETFRIGDWHNNEVFQGYIQEFRITKGLARYTANFTPPTAPFEG